MASGGTYRIVPALYLRYALQKKYLGIFWDSVSYSNSFAELVGTVRAIDGRLLNAPSPHKEVEDEQQ